MFALIRKTLHRLQRRPASDPADAGDMGALIGWLCELVTVGDRSRQVLSEADRFRTLPVGQQQAGLPAIYLLLEKYLVEVQGGHKRDPLRRTVFSKFPHLAADDRFALISSTGPEQEMQLVRLLLLNIVEHATSLYGSVGMNVLPALRTWTADAPRSTQPPPAALGIDGESPQDARQWLAYMIQVTHRLYTWLSTSLGARTAGAIFDGAYRRLRDVYGGLECFPTIISALPDRLLDEEKIELLSRGQIQQVLLDKASELQRINDQLLMQNQELELARGELQQAKEELEVRVQTRTHELTEALSQKNLLLKEVHHRVKNNMQVISSLLNLQANASDSEEAIKVLRESHDRVRSMALIHEQLYNSPDLGSIDFDDYADSLLEQIVASHNSDGGVRVERVIDHPTVSIEVGVPCGLILTELVSNALKHAFPGGRGGIIRVSLQQLDDGASQLCVQDNGIGLPADLDVEKLDSLGLSLVDVLARQLQGSVRFGNNGDGARIEVVFSRGATPNQQTPYPPNDPGDDES